MGAFGIFALILTTAYIIYFAVTISRDIVAGRKRGGDSPESETFEISSSAHDESGSNILGKIDALLHEDSVAVIETENGGFRVGDIEFETSLDSIAVPISSSNIAPKGASTEEERHEVLRKESEEVEQSISNLKLGFEDQSDKIEYEEAVPAEEMEAYICNQRSNSNSHLVHKNGVAAEEPLELEADDGPELQAEQEKESEQREDWEERDECEERDWL